MWGGCTAFDSCGPKHRDGDLAAPSIPPLPRLPSIGPGAGSPPPEQRPINTPAAAAAAVASTAKR